VRVKVFIFLSFWFALSANAQDTLRQRTFSISPMVGIILPHHPHMQFLVDGHIPAFEAEIGFITDGSKPWHNAYNFPTWGVAVNAYNLRSPYLGYTGAARVFYDLPLTRNKALGLKMGIGVAYIEKPFDLETNFHNSAIGSHFNVALALSLYGRISLSEKWILKPGIGIHHFSNGALTLPNTGVNLAVLKLLLSYYPAGYTTKEKILSPFPAENGEWLVGSSFGVKQIAPIGSKRYGVANAFGIWQKRATAKSTFGAELGLNYNASLAHRDVASEKASEKTVDNFRAYIAGLYQLNFDPLGIRLQVGSYLFPNFEADGMIFFKYHVVYKFNRWQVFVGLKSHYAKADNGEIGFAYKLR